MNLDDLSLITQIDSQQVLSEIEAFPNRLLSGWETGQSLPLPPLSASVRQVVFSAVGSPALAADLIAALSTPTCRIPVIVHRDYELPAFAADAETLVVLCSLAGDDEEVLSAFQVALQRNCTILAIGAGGALMEHVRRAGLSFWNYSATRSPSVAVGEWLGLLLALFARLNLMPDPTPDVLEAVQAMRDQQTNLAPAIPAALNPAKRYAGQLVGRWVTIFGAGVLAPVARRWKTQINELAKAPASFESLPEADHNALAALVNPADVLQSRTLVMFLLAPSDHPRNRLRSEFTRQVFMLEGSNTDFYLAKGLSPLAHLCTALQFGDYLAYYLAIAYQTDPASSPVLEHFKETLASQS
ncbi:MAG: hypothetical protein DDG60_12815 [Anaerolineae bacterium]|nr:MAG: hypothetical protein DDG60_12815 [Anaerolineae bacterium]